MEGPLTAPAALTVLYTAGLRGAIEELPRLYTFLRDLRARAEGAAVLLVDMGGLCAPEVWHCAVTGGRSMLVALDGMGYHAANVQGTLPPELRQRMGDLTQMALVDSAHPAVALGTVALTAGGAPADDALPLVLDLDPAPRTTFDGRALRLAGVSGLQVGRARLRSGECEGIDLFDLPSDAEPDPTIAGIVEFILGEARYTARRHEKYT